MSSLPEPLDAALRERLFRWLDPRWIVHEDESLVVVDKPDGIPTQEAREGAGDDLPNRVRQFIQARDRLAELPYLGVHQRLDRETSGLVLYTKRPEVNRAIAAQLEGRTARKTYLACVERWPAAERVTLRQPIALISGRGTVVGARDPRGKPAITHVRLLKRHTRGALLAVTIETGRTHQIRAHLAHAGAPVAGDRRFGGAAAPRLLLHAAELDLLHPDTGAALALRSQLPASFGRWLEGAPEPLEEALARGVERRFALGRAALAEPRTTAFRVLDEHVDTVPGVSVDLYADWLVLHLSIEGDPERDRAREASICEALDALGPAGIYVKRRPRQSNLMDEDTRAALAPASPIRGRAAPEELVVREHGIPFAVRLGDGMSTGLFLDQRDNRARIRALARGRRVLNLFAYTCSLSVAAAVGGATEVTSVDASAAALTRGRANFELAGIEPEGHREVRAEVFEWLEAAARRGERFDLVCCDPPTYSTTKRKRGGPLRWSSGEAWTELAALCFAVASPGAHLILCSNDRRMTVAQLRARARAAAPQGATIRDVHPPEDFGSGTESDLKTLLIER